jgi:hypothetical protein
LAVASVLDTLRDRVKTPIRSLARLVLCVLLLAVPVEARAQAQPAPAPPPWQAAATSFLSMSYEQLKPLIAQLPCPLPGLPPEIAKYVDCSVLRPISESTTYTPIPPPPGMTDGVDHRAQGLAGPVRDQGETGSCSANAIASLMDTFALKKGLAAQRASALHVFAIYEHTAVQGASDDNIGNLRKVSGVTSETTWPYDPIKACRVAVGSAISGCDTAYGVQAGSGYSDPTIIAERTRADGAPLFKVVSLEALPDSPTRDGEIQKLLAAGEAVYLSVDMAINWSIAGPGGFHGDVLPAPGAYYGSHALLLQGYRTTPTGLQFLAQNSWGTNWGQSGFVWIPEDIFKSRARAVYRIHVDMLPGAANNQVALPLPAQVPTAPTAAPPPAPAATAAATAAGPAAPPAPACPAGMQPMFGFCVPMWGGGQ